MIAATCAVLLRRIASTTAIVLAAHAHSVAASEHVFTLDIPAQPLNEALRAFARHTQQQVVFDERAVRNTQAPALRGAYTADAALGLMLAGSGLTYKVGQSGLFIIVRIRPSAATDAPASALTEEIVVTARKREERAIDVPIAITAVAGEGLERRGAHNLADVLQEAPGVGIYDYGNGISKITIRGISTSLGGNENGYYLDDLPFTGVTVPISPDVRAWDLDRVEVLRGPQGSLFGEGSVGGTVRILTQGANLNGWEAKANGFLSGTKSGGANYGVKGALNAPIIPDRLAVRLVGTSERYDGWVDNSTTGRRDLNDQNYDTFRARIRFDPTRRLSLGASYWYYDGDFPGGSSLSTDDGDQSRSLVLATGTTYELYGLTGRYQLDGVELFYGYSHNNLDLPQNGNFLGSTLIGDIGIRVDAHELRLASTGMGPLQWTVGGYSRTSRRADNFVAALFEIDNVDVTKSEAHALFGEATYTLPFAPIDVTAGLRYFEEDIEGFEANRGVVALDTGQTYRSWNPRFSIAWHPGSDATIYASAAKGFRAGQLQAGMSIGLAQALGIDLPASLDQDSIWTYELGAKADLLDRLLSVEAAVYHSKWKDVTVRIPIGTTGFNGLINSEGTKTWGGELSLVVRPIEGLSLSASAAYVDAVYAGDVAGTGIVEGAPVDDVAKFTANASADYSLPLGDRLNGIVRIAWQHSSPRRSVSFPLYQPGDTIDRIDARLGVQFDQLSVALFVDNLTNEQGAASFRIVQPLASGVNDITAYRLRPRTAGVEATLRLGVGN